MSNLDFEYGIILFELVQRWRWSLGWHKAGAQARIKPSLYVWGAMGENVGACESHVQDKEAEGKQAEQLYQDLTQRYLPAWMSEQRAGGWQ